ncbi:MAG TPA: hypothetical protein VIM68_01410 [Thermoanaerobaculia bacterium]|jgi:hypothetical protein
MKRTIIAAAWLAGTTIPLALSAIFVFGCCVLPFHMALHRALPLCQIAEHMLHADHHDGVDDHHPAPPPTQKQVVSGPSLLTILTMKRSIVRSDSFALSQPQYSPVSHRTFITLGALRCDQDVGLQRLLIETYRI